MTMRTFWTDLWRSSTVCSSSPDKRLGQLQRWFPTGESAKRGQNSLASSGALEESLQKRMISQAILDPWKTAPTTLKGSILSDPMFERKHRGPYVAYDKVQGPTGWDVEMVGNLVVTRKNTGPRIRPPS